MPSVKIMWVRFRSSAAGKLWHKPLSILCEYVGYRGSSFSGSINSNGTEVQQARRQASRFNLRLRANTVRDQRSNSEGPSSPKTALSDDTGMIKVVSGVSYESESAIAEANTSVGGSICSQGIADKESSKRESIKQKFKRLVRATRGGDAFWYSGLANALAKKNEDDINREILKNFFEDHDKSRLDEVEILLEKYKGREEVLFEMLNEQYPDPVSSGPAVRGESFSSMVQRDSLHTQAGRFLPSFNTPASEDKDFTETLRGKDIPVFVGPVVGFDDTNQTDYILSAVALRADHATGPRRQWATNIHDNMLRRRMIKAGTSAEEADAVLQNIANV